MIWDSLFLNLSGENNKLSLLKAVVCGKPVIMSTGMCCEIEIKEHWTF
jgi:sialic acid synthase SpsE